MVQILCMYHYHFWFALTRSIPDYMSCCELDGVLDVCFNALCTWLYICVGCVANWMQPYLKDIWMRWLFLGETMTWYIIGVVHSSEFWWSKLKRWVVWIVSCGDFWVYLNLHLLLRNPIDFFTNDNDWEILLYFYYTFRMELYVEDVLTWLLKYDASGHIIYRLVEASSALALQWQTPIEYPFVTFDPNSGSQWAHSEGIRGDY